MTPTLLGRWQSRIFLNILLGTPFTLLFMAAFGAFECDPYDVPYWKLVITLGYVTVFGLFWDLLWIAIQSTRWDRDFPMVFQLATGGIEGCVVFVLFYYKLLYPMVYENDDDWHFALHYGSIWLSSFCFLFGPMRVMFPRWRYRGGQLLGGK